MNAATELPVILLAGLDGDRTWGLADYVKRGGYAALRKILETGMTPLGDSTGGAMERVIANMSQLSAEDRMAMAVYLKSLSPVEDPKRPGKS